MSDDYRPDDPADIDTDLDDLSGPGHRVVVETIQACAELVHQTLGHTLGSLGRPEVQEIGQAIYEALAPYTVEGYQVAGSRYSTLALMEGKVMMVMDHEAWAWQVFAVTSPACLLPGQPPGPAPVRPPAPGRAVEEVDAVDFLRTAPKG